MKLGEAIATLARLAERLPDGLETPFKAVTCYGEEGADVSAELEIDFTGVTADPAAPLSEWQELFAIVKSHPHRDQDLGPVRSFARGG